MENKQAQQSIPVLPAPLTVVTPELEVFMNKHGLVLQPQFVFKNSPMQPRVEGMYSTPQRIEYYQPFEDVSKKRVVVAVPDTQSKRTKEDQIPPGAYTPDTLASQLLAVDKLRHQVATLEQEKRELTEKNKELLQLVTPMLNSFKELSDSVSRLNEYLKTGSTHPEPAQQSTTSFSPYPPSWPPEAKYMSESNWTAVRVSIAKPTPEYCRILRQQTPARYKFSEDWINECHRLLSSQSRQKFMNYAAAPFALDPFTGSPKGCDGCNAWDGNCLKSFTDFLLGIFQGQATKNWAKKQIRSWASQCKKSKGPVETSSGSRVSAPSFSSSSREPTLETEEAAKTDVEEEKASDSDDDGALNSSQLKSYSPK